MRRLTNLLSLSILSLLTSCVKTEVLNAPTYEGIDTAVKREKPHKPDRPPRDTTEVDDTARVPIGWNPSVEDWNEENINL